MILMAATYLDDETILNKLPWLTQEEVQEILKRKDAENLDRFNGKDDMQTREDEQQESPEGEE